jgi:tetratricopeptide (TPR) repeat protein
LLAPRADDRAPVSMPPLVVKRAMTAGDRPLPATKDGRASAAPNSAAAAPLADVDTATLLRERAALLAQAGQFEQAADVWLASLAAADSAAAIEPALIAYKTLVQQHLRELEPRAIAVRAEYVATLALPAPYAEEAGHLACENALAARSFATAYQLCHRFLERFPGSARTRDVAYLTASVARLYLGDCQAAVEHYTTALVFSGTLQSYNDEAYLGRALCYTQLGQLDAARSDLDMYLHKRPDQAASDAVRDLTRRLQKPQPK